MSKKRIGIILALTGILVSGEAVIASTSHPAQKSAPLSPQMKYLDQLVNSIKPEVLASEYDTATVSIDPILKGKGWAKDSTSNLTTSLKLLRYFGYSPVYPIRAYISWGPSFKNKFIPVYCQYSGGGGYCGEGIMFADVKWFADMWQSKDKSKSKYPDETNKVAFLANLPHEIGHVLQESAKYKTESQNKNLQPAWLREGSAEFFKLASYSIQNDIPYSTLRNDYLKYWKYCKGVKLETLTGQGSSKSNCEYNNGLVALEYLIWKTQSLDALFIFPKTSGANQAEVFQNAFGFNQSAFQKEADKYVVSSTSKIPSN
jgi:hypothetical protein